MLKKALALLLALVLLAGAAPAAFAETGDEVWILYTEDDGETFTATVVAPAKYVRLTDEAKFETVFTAGQAESGVYAAEAVEIPYYFDGVTLTRLALTFTCPVPDGSVPGYDMMFALLPGSVLDAAGHANGRVYFDDGTDYRPPEGYAGIDVYSALLLRDYAREDGTVAVGDTVRIGYSGLYPVEIFINGERAAALPGGEMQERAYAVAETGTLSVAVRQNGKELAVRTLTVVTAEEMYARNLREGLITGDDIPSTGDLMDVGVPFGSPFIPLAKVVAFFVALREFFFRLFSFVRLTN